MFVNVFVKVCVWWWGGEWTNQVTTFPSPKSESWCQHLQQVQFTESTVYEALN